MFILTKLTQQFGAGLAKARAEARLIEAEAARQAAAAEQRVERAFPLDLFWRHKGLLLVAGAACVASGWIGHLI